MLTRLRVKNFQSLHDVDIELGKFTVIVGASNSGKSALLRSTRTLFTNVNHSNFVTKGKKASSIRITTEHPSGPLEIMLDRGRGTSTYRVIDAKKHESIYGKAGMTVPEEIQAYVPVAEIEGELLNFAFQFDRPFLLAEPATKVAKILGDLTSITMIFDAVREANRRKLEASQKLKVRRTDKEHLEAKLTSFSDLPAKSMELDRCAKLFEAATTKQTRVDQLDAHLVRAATAASALARLGDLGPLPDAEAELKVLEVKAHRVDRLGALMEAVGTGHDSLVSQLKRNQDEWALADHEEAKLEERYHDLLKSSGTCPLCGQKTTELEGAL